MLLQRLVLKVMSHVCAISRCFDILTSQILNLEKVDESHYVYLSQGCRSFTNIQIYESCSVYFMPVLKVSEILKCSLSKVGQCQVVQFWQLRHLMTNVKICEGFPCIFCYKALIVSDVIKWKMF